MQIAVQSHILRYDDLYSMFFLIVIQYTFHNIAGVTSSTHVAGLWCMWWHQHLPKLGIQDQEEQANICKCVSGFFILSKAENYKAQCSPQDLLRRLCDFIKTMCCTYKLCGFSLIFGSIKPGLQTPLAPTEKRVWRSVCDDMLPTIAVCDALSHRVSKRFWRKWK